MVAATMLLLMVASCGHSIFPGYEKMETGAYMKFYERGNSGPTPRVGDRVTLEMVQYFGDTVLFTTVGDQPLELFIDKANFVGDVPDALRMMHIGDSARLVMLADSVFIVVMQEEVPVEYAGKPIYYDLKLLAIKPFEEIEAKRKAVLDSLSVMENEYLIGLQADKKNVVTESGLIIMEKKGEGKLAKIGDHLTFDFTMCDKKGDTMINTFGKESFEIQYGEELIGEGFNEALGMVPEGGMMRFVIPSDLAFDSVGYEGMILPYTPLVVTMKMNSIMDKDAYEEQQAAEKTRRRLAEDGLIAEYIKENGITETPTESGIYIVRKEEGEGNLAQWGDDVAMHYVLKNLKGDKVESSYDYDQPIEFKLGNNEMIPAIEEALMTMAPGAKVTVIAPSELSFGEVSVDEKLLPANSPVVIELELVEIK